MSLSHPYLRIGLANNQLPMTCVTLYNEKSVPNPIANNPISFNPETNPVAPNPIAMLITDIVLLLTMLVGLFRLHRHGSGMLAQVLWKQVGYRFLLVVVLESIDVSFRKGVVWLFLTIVALVPSTVSPTNVSPIFFSFISISRPRYS